VKLVPLAAALAALAAPAHAADPYFKGRTVTLIVGHAAGGGVDIAARLLAPTLSKHIPGQPSVVVKNMPGAGAMQAHNYVFEVAKGDGETILHGPWFPVHQLLDAPGIRFKYQDFTPIGAYNVAGLVMYGRVDMVPEGIKRGADIARAKDIRFGASNPYNTFDLHGRLALEILGVSYRYVTGYPGSAVVRPAIMKNEVNLAVDVTSSYRATVEPTLIKTNIAAALFAFPEKDSSGKYGRSSELGELPSFIEVHRDITGKDPSGPKWDLLDLVLTLQGVANQMVLGPPKMAPEAVADLRKGLDATLNDKELLAETKTRLGFTPQPVKAEQVAGIMRYLMSVKPELIAGLREHVKSGESK
jgi:hypothetical protein